MTDDKKVGKTDGVEAKKTVGVQLRQVVGGGGTRAIVAVVLLIGAVTPGSDDVRGVAGGGEAGVCGSTHER